MDVDFVHKELLRFAQKRKKWILGALAFGITGYGAYKIYHCPYLAEKRARLRKAFSAFVTVADVVSDSAEMVGVLSREVKDFLQSDSDEIPNSLNQISKIAKSEEFTESVIGFTAAFIAGVSRGSGGGPETAANGSEIENNSGFCCGVMDKLFSDAGSGFASAVVGSFARNLVMAAISSDDESKKGSRLKLENQSSKEKSVPEWISVACNDKSKVFIGECIQVFVSTAVAVYLDKTMDINVYEDFFAGLTNSKHERRVRELLVSVCNNAIDTLAKTSHQVLTANSGSSVSPKPAMNSGLRACLVEENGDEILELERGEHGQGETSEEIIVTKVLEQENHSSWGSAISSTLSEPTNRRFILSVTGRVTFETVRSFLEFLLEKVLESSKTGFDAVIDRGFDVLRYFTLKSFVIAAVCISLCLFVLLGDTWVLAPPQSLQV